MMRDDSGETAAAYVRPRNDLNGAGRIRARG